MPPSLLQLARYGHQFDGALNRYKAALYPHRYLTYRRWFRQQNTIIPTDQPLVIFDFRDSRIDGPQGRRFYCLFIFFVRAGFYPLLCENYFFLGNIQDKFKKLCLQENFSVLRANQVFSRDYILVTDKKFSRSAQAATKVITINFLADYSLNDTCFPMPFPMFPQIYALRQDLGLQDYRQQTRLWRIFFGGDANPEKYDKKTIRDIYAKLSRARILQTIRKQTFSDYEYRELHSNADLKDATTNCIRGVVVMNTSQCKVDAIEWLGTLANSDFFLACPGVRYPMSHNLIEALAVGSIPITQYPEMFFPPLEHGKNCLVFTDETELLALLPIAVAMPTAQLNKLRQGALEYYDSYLAPKACIDNLLHHNTATISLRLLPFLKTGGGFA